MVALNSRGEQALLIYTPIYLHTPSRGGSGTQVDPAVFGMISACPSCLFDPCQYRERVLLGSLETAAYTSGRIIPNYILPILPLDIGVIFVCQSAAVGQDPADQVLPVICSREKTGLMFERAASCKNRAFYIPPEDIAKYLVRHIIGHVVQFREIAMSVLSVVDYICSVRILA